MKQWTQLRTMMHSVSRAPGSCGNISSHPTSSPATITSITPRIIGTVQTVQLETGENKETCSCITPWKWQTTFLVQDFERMTPSTKTSCGENLFQVEAIQRAFAGRWLCFLHPRETSTDDYQLSMVVNNCCAPVVIWICFWGPVNLDPSGCSSWKTLRILKTSRTSGYHQ